MITRFAALFALGALLAMAEEVNRPAKDLDIKMENGQMVKLSQWKGKPILLVFFSTTCPHCQKSAEAVEKILRTYGPKGLQIIAVSNDENQRKEFPEFRRKYGATYAMGTVKRDAGYEFFGMSMMQPFYVPSFGFIDKAHVLREKFIGGMQATTPAAEAAELAKHLDPLFKTAPVKTAAQQSRPAPARAGN